MDATGRRVRTLRVSGVLVAAMFMGPRSSDIEVRGMPADAKIIGADYDAFRDEMRFLVQSEAFAVVPPGGTIPEFIIEVRRHHHHHEEVHHR